MHFVLLGLCASVVLTACSSITIGEQDIFHPKPSITPETFDLEGVDLTDTYVSVTESVDVNVWHLRQPDAGATVLFFGGNGFYLVQSKGYVRALTRPPVDALLWDYRGYGRSGGEPSVEAFRNDALALYDYLVGEQSVAPNEIVVWGHSLGSFLATHVATERRVAGVVLENPATTVDDWVGHLVPWYLRLFVRVTVDSALRGESNVAPIRRLDVPLLIIGGMDDQVTDPDMARRLHQEAASPHKDLVLVEEGGHNGLYDDPTVREAYEALIGRVGGSSEGS